MYFWAHFWLPHQILYRKSAFTLQKTHFQKLTKIWIFVKKFCVKPRTLSWVSVHDIMKINDSWRQLSKDVVRYRWKSVISAKSCIWRWMVRNVFCRVYVWSSWIKVSCERNKIVKVKLCVQTQIEQALLGQK